MKKIIYTLVAMIGMFGAVSCSDMLETESSSQLNDPSLSAKTDSVFYAYGILQAMQQLADQYYLQNEMRGDLGTTSKYATTDLRDLSNYDVNASNKYDSVYLYYKVINNCNYYLKNRKKDLVTGSTYVVMNEYIAVASLRAWAYLQLVRNYGDVPYITEPVATISQINAQQYATSANMILASEAEYLEGLKKEWSYEYWDVPTFGITTDQQIGGNGARSKYFRPEKCFVPLNVVLGDLYLENGQYENAALAYYDYLYYTSLKGEDRLNINYANIRRNYENVPTSIDLPASADLSALNVLYDNSSNWNNIFAGNAVPGDVITYIPMAASVLNGQTTNVPEIFGYDYYGTGNGTSADSYYPSGELEIHEVQALPTKDFKNVYTKAPFYYQKTKEQNARYAEIASDSIGDGRFNFVTNGKNADSLNIYTVKPSTGYFYLYRTSTVYLHLAEAMNRMGYPDAAFAVLKTGLVGNKLKQFIDTAYIEKPLNPNPNIIYYDRDVYFLSSEAAKMLSTTLHFLPVGNDNGTDDGSAILKSELYNVGIHFHGAGAVTGTATLAKQSSYKYMSVLDAKIIELNKKFGLGIKRTVEQTFVKYDRDESGNVITGADGTPVVKETKTFKQSYDPSNSSATATALAVLDDNRNQYMDTDRPDAFDRCDEVSSYAKDDAINAMEDILCDEYALEFAFEGCRFGDLQRFARHKNEFGLYGGSFGDRWLTEKLYKKTGKSITTQNCYLPFK